jgi:hypothetical protein
MRRSIETVGSRNRITSVSKLAPCDCFRCLSIVSSGDLATGLGYLYQISVRKYNFPHFRRLLISDVLLACLSSLPSKMEQHTTDLSPIPEVDRFMKGFLETYDVRYGTGTMTCSVYVQFRPIGLVTFLGIVPWMGAR